MRPIVSNPAQGTWYDNEEIRRGSHLPQPPWCSITDPQMPYNLSALHQATQFVSKCAFPAPDPSLPLLLQFNKQQVIT